MWKIITIFSILITGQVKAKQIINFNDLKMLSQKTTAILVFDESKNISANFGLWQNDEGLTNYFSKKNGESFLCGPTTLADFLIYHMGITHKLPISDKIPGISRDYKSIDADELIIELTKLCKTDIESGTDGNDYMFCIGNSIKKFFGKDVTIDRIIKTNDPRIKNPKNVLWQNRNPTFSDIKKAIDADEPIITSIDWKMYDPINQTIKNDGGHIFPIYGYAYQDYFQDFAIQLDITDPNAPAAWSVNQTNSDFNIVSAFREKDRSDYIFLDGRGFNGQTDRAYLTQLAIIHIKP